MMQSNSGIRQEKVPSEALERLIKYNREDTVNLMQIATILYERLKHSTGIEEYLSCGVA